MTDPYDYFGVVIPLLFAVLFAVLFYRIGEIEYDRGALMALASIAVSVTACVWLNQGLPGLFVGHLLLFGGMWVVNLKRRV